MLAIVAAPAVLATPLKLPFRYIRDAALTNRFFFNHPISNTFFTFRLYPWASSGVGGTGLAGSYLLYHWLAWLIDCRCTVHTVKYGSGLCDPPYNKLSYELVVFDNNLIMKIIHKIFLVLMLVMFIVVLKGKVSRNFESCDSLKKKLKQNCFHSYLVHWFLIQNVFANVSRYKYTSIYIWPNQYNRN